MIWKRFELSLQAKSSTHPNAASWTRSTLEKSVNHITRKFWIDSHGHRWIVYCAGAVLVAMVREELDVREVA